MVSTLSKVGKSKKLNIETETSLACFATTSCYRQCPDRSVGRPAEREHVRKSSEGRG